MKCEGRHKHPVHLNFGRQGAAWLCIACGKQIGGKKVLDESEREAISEFLTVLTANRINGLPLQEKERMGQLELVVMAGKESKQWLADVTQIVERLEKVTAKLKGSSVTEETEETQGADADADEDDDFTPTKSKAKMKASSFDEDDDTGEDDEAPVTKKKAKKITVDDVNDACKARAAETGGKEGRKEVLTILKKKFKVESVSDLEPEQYAAVIAAMKTDNDD